MELKSKVHGNLNYKNKDVIIFKKGLFGLEEFEKFAIIELDEIKPFKILHSLENEELSLIVVNPFEIEKDYEIKLNGKIIENLKIKKEEDVLLYTVVTLNSNVSKITTNFSAPIVINVNENLGEQIVLDNFKYKIKHPVYKEC